MYRTLIVAAAFTLLPCLMYSQSEILGVWFNEEKDGKIKVYKEGGKFYGEIIWIKDNKNEDGSSPKYDINNPDPNKRDRTIVGTQILKNLEWDSSEDEWNEGTIYDPKSGNTYDVFARLEGPKTLYLKGYIGFTLIGRSTLWTRVE
jgi:uncharacterized protein (DUF2147 family)